MQARDHVSTQRTVRDGCLLLADIPLDIIYLILDYLSLQDFITFTKVAKFCRGLLHHDIIWRRLYQRSTLPLPPGPAEWQSVSDLSDPLIKSTKVQINWPPNLSRPQIIRSRHIPINRDDAGFSVILDRWILVAGGSNVLCYDSHSTALEESAKVLINGGDGGRIQSIKSAWKAYADGRVAAFAAIYVEQELKIMRIIMASGEPSGAEIIVTRDLSSFRHLAPIIAAGLAMTLRHRLLIITLGSYGPDWETSERLIILDADTLRQYHIPKLASEAVPIIQSQDVTSVFETRTHLIKSRSTYTREAGWHSFLECFPIPPVNTPPEITILECSHQDQIHDIKLQTPFLIQDSLEGPQTGQISFTIGGLLLDPFRTNRPSLSVIDVCLEAAGGISCERVDILRMQNAGSLRLDSLNGHARGICQNATKPELTAFSFDYQPELTTFSWSEPIRIPEESYFRRKLVTFDAFGGTAYFDVTGTKSGRVVEILDFASDLKQSGEPARRGWSRGRGSSRTSSSRILYPPAR
ncbi:hypothetical protein HYDPIDRAFT_29745 [Hydnomerulius pinastri MD-312]|uniref:F-box domain-containing protein n=1 Tax=Hydnomerulius pinastri MD-312 TaxID=994086 RepID=A0A0C9WE54_9AGAM|nr:hypothetical protein HYDPIDRAFT_29745 [Hydnomerulius pinastri MD-312]